VAAGETDGILYGPALFTKGERFACIAPAFYDNVAASLDKLGLRDLLWIAENESRQTCSAANERQAELLASSQRDHVCQPSRHTRLAR
jgi:hypothetical protein